MTSELWDCVVIRLGILVKRPGPASQLMPTLKARDLLPQSRISYWAFLVYMQVTKIIIVLFNMPSFPIYFLSLPDTTQFHKDYFKF